MIDRDNVDNIVDKLCVCGWWDHDLLPDRRFKFASRHFVIAHVGGIKSFCLLR